METQRRADNLSDLQAAWLVIVRDMRMAFPGSQVANLDDDQCLSTAISWAKHLSSIPLDRIESVYGATAVGCTYPPSVGDVAKSWETIRHDEFVAAKAVDWKADDDRQRKALPAGDHIGPGRRAALEFFKLGYAIVCDCVTEKNWQLPARLAHDSSGWGCQQAKTCGFWLPIERTSEAPIPRESRSGITDLLAEAVANVQARPAQAKTKMQIRAEDAGLDWDTLEGPVLMRFRQFCDWWDSKYECIITNELMHEFWQEFVDSLPKARVTA